ncbi:MAG: hypothetical protein JWQ49_3975 [Edaphobacter sp.]|nr:hypothetical protein [Edaphobacter sp.]
MHAGIDAWVAVSEGGAGDVDAVGAEVDGAAGTNEVVDADAALGREVPDAGVCVGAVILRVVRRAAEGRVFVIGPDNTAGGLAPERESACAGEVPAHDDGGDGDSGEGAAYGIERGTDGCSAGRIGAEGALELWRVGLPEGEDLDGVLEVAAQGAGAHVGGENLAGVHACHEEFEAVAVLGEAEAALNDGADLEGPVGGEVLMEGVDVAGGYRLRGGESGGGEQEGKDPDGRGCDALRAFGQSMSPDVSVS